MLLFRVYFAFIAAEAANLVTSGFHSNNKNIEKVKRIFKKCFIKWISRQKYMKNG